ncbi:unnamed protein product [Peronospora farinosa]|uniref:Peptidase A2 domain-containing protein n=1 Tax=Peronospora farinosa TaxID=134698 RepID=A0AAV0SW57_9STRA|nr:unnamed protein product [Peronospora farinosa]
MELDLLPGESRGYWKYHDPTKWFRQAKASGKVNNDHANLLLDTGAEISILDIAFAPVYTTEGRTRIKVILNGNLVYIFKVWVDPMVGQDAILGMDFMVPAGIRLELADGTLCLPDEVRISVGGCTEVPLKRSTSEQWKLEQVPRTPGFVSVGSRRYAEWLNLTYESTTDQVDHQADPTEEEEGPIVERPEYKTPSHILQRPAAPTPMMNMTYQPIPDRDEQPCEEEVNWQEGSIQERSVAKEDLPVVITTMEKEAKLVDLLQADDQVCSFESGELWAEDIRPGWAVVPEVDPSSEGIALEDIQIPDPDGNTPEEVDRLRQ